MISIATEMLLVSSIDGMCVTVGIKLGSGEGSGVVGTEDVGTGVGIAVGTEDGTGLGRGVVGTLVGTSVGKALGAFVGSEDGTIVG